MLPYFGARPCCSTLSFRGAPPGPETGNFPIIHVRVSSGSSTEPRLEARGLCEQRGHTELVDPRRDWLVQAKTISPATSKLYTRAVLPPAILACSSSGTPARISARIFRDWGKVDSLCG